MHLPTAIRAAAAVLACAPAAQALLTGVGRVPTMGWSSWYGFTSNISEDLIRGMADAMASSGLAAFGWKYVNIDDGWASVARNATTNELVADAALFPSGMASLAAYIHARNLSFGIYTDRGSETCLGRNGSLGFEALDAETFASWGVDFVKEDSCYGARSSDVDYGIMRDALNATGRQMVFNICNPGFGSGEFGHSWRTAPDLYSQQWAMTLNRFQASTTPAQRAATGPGAFPDPDNLEVGYSPRSPPGAGATPLEQRSMFSMWAILPAPLVLAADLRSLDNVTLSVLTNAAVIAVNQDVLAAPGTPVVGDAFSTASVWAKPLANGDVAVMLLNTGAAPATIGFTFAQVGFPASGGGNASFTVADLWSGASTEVYGDGYAASALSHEAVMLRVSAPAAV